jgi:diketogulonate reductase-like aldo/keto reductase
VIASIEDTVRLNNGIRMPWLGLGTWRSKEGDEARDSVRTAIELGYRHIDTAAVYKNEDSVGAGIRESGLPREELFVTTKVWNDDLRSGRVIQALETSLKKLGLDYVDLYLVHWPVPGKFVDAWAQMEDLYRQGKTRAIGVSNFHIHHLDELNKAAAVRPAVNQVEFHPHLQQTELVARCRQEGIVFEAWSPLMQGKVAEVPQIVQIAESIGRTPAQVALRWALQKGIVVIPKSTRRERLEENAAIFDFDLSAEDVATIDRLDKNQRVGPDPDNFTF